MLFCHGVGLHADKFDELYAMLVRHGYDVVAFDALGHGETAGHPMRADTLDDVAAATLEVYDRIAHERPVLLGVGAFGGFSLRRIVAHSRGSGWQPPCVFYSVDYAPMPPPMLRFLGRHRRLLRALDRVRMGYDHRLLTTDAAADDRFVDDPRVWTRLPLGFVLRVLGETNAFYELSRADDVPCAFLIGEDERLSHVPPVIRAASRQPGYRLWRVAGGRTHLHRDRPPIAARFDAALGEALAFVAAWAGPDGRVRAPAAG